MKVVLDWKLMYILLSAKEIQHFVTCKRRTGHCQSVKFKDSLIEG